MKKIDVKRVYHEDPVTPPDAPTHTGYNFIGWDKDLCCVIDDMDVYTEYQLKTYNVIFKYEGIQYDSQTKKHGEVATFAGTETPPSQTGYNFVWDDGKAITADTVITGGYYRSDGWYQVKFICCDAVINTQFVQSGSNATCPTDPVRSGWIFLKWDPSSQNIKKDTNCVAQWKEVLQTVTIKGTEKYKTGSTNDDISNDYLVANVPNPFKLRSAKYKFVDPFTDMNKKTCITYVFDNSSKIKTIGEKCFQYTTNQYVTTACFDGVETIGKQAFQKCKYLSTVSFKSLKTCGEKAFQNAFQKSNVTLSFPSLTAVAERSFDSCDKLQGFTANSATSVGEYAFNDCSELQTVNLSSVTSVGKNSFRRCGAINELDIRSIQTISEQAFYANGCSKCHNTSLTALYIPQATSIGDNALEMFNSVTNLTLNNCWKDNLPKKLWGLGTYKDGTAKNTSGSAITITYT